LCDVWAAISSTEAVSSSTELACSAAPWDKDMLELEIMPAPEAT
jgi:hypothetical protein